MQQSWSDLTPWCRTGQVIEIKVYSDTRSPLSAGMVQRKGKLTQLTQLQELLEGVAVLNQPPHRATTLDNISWG